MCIVHGQVRDPRLQSFLRQTMSLENARKVLDEVMRAKPLVQPNLWSEPLLIPEFKEHVRQIKQRGLALAMNTNGLGLKEELAQFLVDIEVDSIFVSIDATRPETLKKVRGITRLDLIHRAVDLLLATRGDEARPRLGVSMTLQDANRHEREEFVAYWTPRVDVVRVGEIFEDGRFRGVRAPAKRIPCQAIYSTMPIHTNGNVSMCCLDGFNETNLGNVFVDGVKEVWHGPELTRIRHLHETGHYDQIPLCRNCERWASFTYQEAVKDGLLIRWSTEYTYYNRLEKLDNWQGDMRGLHTPGTESLSGGSGGPSSEGATT
jgi:radical SAM protein with 4Fe4S-binding SPASM domain